MDINPQVGISSDVFGRISSSNLNEQTSTVKMCLTNEIDSTALLVSELIQQHCSCQKHTTAKYATLMAHVLQNAGFTHKSNYLYKNQKRTPHTYLTVKLMDRLVGKGIWFQNIQNLTMRLKQRKCIIWTYCHK